MNLINRLHLFAAASRDIVLHRGRKLEFVTDNATTEIVNESSAVCNFNLTDNFLANDENIEVYMYEAGEVCSFALTTISYITEPMSAQIYNGDNSNTFEMMDSHHLAVMKSDGTGVVYCIHDAATLANSTQHRDGSATFSIKSGEIAVTPPSIGDWTNVSVNGGWSWGVEAPGFYYVEDGSVSGNVVFLDEAKMETEANYTAFEGNLVDLCAEVNPQSLYLGNPVGYNSAVARNTLLAVSAMIPASVFLFF
eukprot:scaffold3356_cov154-Skeletonema_menzelii.AAC.16